MHPGQVRAPLGGLARPACLGLAELGDHVLQHLLLELRLVAQVDQRPGQCRQRPVEVRRPGSADQLVGGIEHDPGQREADQAVDHERPFRDVPRERQAHPDGVDRLVGLSLGHLHPGLDPQQSAPLPHALGVGEEDLDGVRPLLGQRVVPVARPAARAVLELLELAGPRIDELVHLGDGELIDRHLVPLRRHFADLPPERFHARVFVTVNPQVDRRGVAGNQISGGGQQPILERRHRRGRGAQGPLDGLRRLRGLVLGLLGRRGDRPGRGQPDHEADDSLHRAVLLVSEVEDAPQVVRPEGQRRRRASRGSGGRLSGSPKGVGPRRPRPSAPSSPGNCWATAARSLPEPAAPGQAGRGATARPARAISRSRRWERSPASVTAIPAVAITRIPAASRQGRAAERPAERPAS